MSIHKKRAVVGKATMAAGCIMAVVAYYVGFSAGLSREVPAPPAAGTVDTHRSPDKAPPRTSADPLTAQSVELSASEFEQFKVEPAVERDFTIQREAVGNIDFNQEMSVAVFPPVQGKILTLLARAGDDVKKGMALYTIDRPDLCQAGSSLISAAGVLNMTTRVLERDRKLQEVQAIPQKELDQAVSDHQAAEAALQAAHNAVRIFGKTDADMDRIIA